MTMIELDDTFWGGNSQFHFNSFFSNPSTHKTHPFQMKIKNFPLPSETQPAPPVMISARPKIDIPKTAPSKTGNRIIKTNSFRNGP